VKQPPSALFGVGMIVVVLDLIFGLIAANALTVVLGIIPIVLSVIGIIIGAILLTKNTKQGAIVLSISLLFLITTIFIWFMVLVLLKHH